MKLSSDGADFIKSFEALMLTGYMPTPDDVPTIGWGHTGEMLDGSPVKVGSTISEDEAEQLFQEDVEPVEDCINDVVNVVPLSQPQFDALCSLVFNVGIVGFNSSNLREAIITRDEPNIEPNWLDWCYQNGVELQGLVNRRNAEWQMYSQSKVTL
jgi:lysozyme